MLAHLCCFWECENNAKREQSQCPVIGPNQKVKKNHESGLYVTSSRSRCGTVLGTGGYKAAEGYCR